MAVIPAQAGIQGDGVMACAVASFTGFLPLQE